MAAHSSRERRFGFWLVPLGTGGVLVTVLLTVWLLYVEPYARQDRILAALTGKMDVREVHYSNPPRGFAETLRIKLGVQHFRPVYHVVLAFRESDPGAEREMRMLSRMPFVENIDFRNALPATYLHTILKTRTLHRVRIRRILMNDANARELPLMPQINEIDGFLYPAPARGLTDRGIADFIAKCPNLRFFNDPVSDDASVMLDGYRYRYLGAIPYDRDHESKEKIATREIMDPRISEALARCVHLEYLALRNYALSDDDLARFARLQQLQELRFHSTPRITDAGLKSLASLRKLKRLDLSHSAITDAGLEWLHDLDIEYLDVSNTPVKGPGLRHLRKCNHLYIWNTGVADEGLAFLNAFLTDTEGESPPQAPPRLQVLLAGPRITDAGLKHLEKCPQLADLSLHESSITGAGLKRCLDRLPQIRRLDLSRCTIDFSDCGADFGRLVARFGSVGWSFDRYHRGWFNVSNDAQ